MSFGLEVYGESGELYFSETGKYARLVDIFNPFSIGVPGSRSYSIQNLGKVLGMIRQGNSRALTVTVSEGVVSWKYSDNQSWPEFSTPASIVILQEV